MTGIVFSRLATTIGFAYALQLGAAAVFVPLKTEVSTLNSLPPIFISPARLLSISLNPKT